MNIYVEAPKAQPLKYGLFSVSEVIDSSEAHWQNGVQYLPLCGGANTAVQPCDQIVFTATGGGGVGPYPVTLTFTGTFVVDWGDGTVETLTDGGSHNYATSGEKTISATSGDAVSTAVLTLPTTTSVDSSPIPKEMLDRPDLIIGSPITVYALTGCNMVGQFPQAQGEAMENLTLGEERAVETGVLSRILSGATVIEDGSTLTTAQGIAALEGYAAQVYGGRPTFHASRTLASLLGTQGVKTNGNHLETILGTPLAAGAGYQPSLAPDGSDAPDGSEWLYATGPVVVRRAPAQTYGPVPNLSTMDNTYVAMAERTYVVTVDCFRAAVLVSTF